MKRKILFNAFLLTIIVLMAGCSKVESARHEVLMKGQILDLGFGCVDTQ